MRHAVALRISQVAYRKSHVCERRLYIHLILIALYTPHTHQVYVLCNIKFSFEKKSFVADIIVKSHLKNETENTCFD